MGAVAGGGCAYRPVGGVLHVPADERPMHVTYATFPSRGVTRSAPGTQGRRPPSAITAVTCAHGGWQGGGAGPDG